VLVVFGGERCVRMAVSMAVELGVLVGVVLVGWGGVAILFVVEGVLYE
jgi:hypothetical protein